MGIASGDLLATRSGQLRFLGSGGRHRAVDCGGARYAWSALARALCGAIPPSLPKSHD